MLAHQGGWDEALFVAVPMAFIAWMLWYTRKRAVRAAAARQSADEPEVTQEATVASAAEVHGDAGAPPDPPLSPPG